MQNWFVQDLETGKKNEPLVRFSVRFRSECKLIFYVSTMYNVCTLYLFYNVKKTSTTAKLSRAETSIILFNFWWCPICEVHTYTVTISFRHSTWIRYQKSYILVSDHIYQNLSSQFNLAAQIEPVQDKIVYLVTKQLKIVKKLLY